MRRDQGCPIPSAPGFLGVCTSAASTGRIWRRSPEGIADEMRSRRGYPRAGEIRHSRKLEFRIFGWFWPSACAETLEMWISHRLTCAPSAAAAGTHHGRVTVTKSINNCPVPLFQGICTFSGSRTGITAQPSFLHVGPVICYAGRPWSSQEPPNPRFPLHPVNPGSSLPGFSVLRAGAMGVFQAALHPC